MNKLPKKIIIFITDQQRADTFSGLGHPVIKTPNYDWLMDNGVTFTRAYSENPICVPSRGNLWTGLPSHVSGIMNNGTKIPLGTLCLPEYFTDLNWYTVTVGRLHFSPARNPHGFQRNFLSEGKFYEKDYLTERDEDYNEVPAAKNQNAKKGHQTDEYLMPGWGSKKVDGEEITSWVTNTAIEELKRTGDTPTFMNMGFIRPHPKFLAPVGWATMYDPEAIPLPENRSEREGLPRAVTALQNRKQENMTIHDYCRDDILKDNMAIYYGDISHIDKNLGNLIDSLKESGMWDDTLLIATSDHGEMLGNHGLYLKHNFYEESSRIPLIMSWPNGLPKGKQINDVVLLQDVFTTCLELIEHPMAKNYATYKHANLIDIVNNPLGENNRVYIETTGGCQFGICNVSTRYKYSLYTYEDGSFDDSLYDLETDPKENVNIVGSSPELVHKFRTEIYRHLTSTIDENHRYYKNLYLLKNLI